jgi:hypothetical protein
VHTLNSSSVPFPYCLHDALARAYAHAQEVHAGAAPSVRDIIAAFAHGHAPVPPGAPARGGANDGGAPASVGGLLEMPELFAVMREPIAWVFTLAERRAQGDVVDLEAIERMRDAVLHRIDAIVAGAVASEPPRIRAADLLTVAGLLVDSLNPAIVRRAVQMLSAGLVEALGVLWPLISPPVDDTEPALDGCCGSCGPDSGATHVDYHHCALRATPFAIRCAMPFSAPCIPRPPAPPWCWPFVNFPF